MTSRAFTTIYTIVGAFLVTSMLSLFYESLAERVAQLAFQTVHGGGKWEAKQSLCARFMLAVTGVEALLLGIWVAVGVLYGMHFEQWSVIRSLYFSCTALSTGGLEGANADGLLFVGFYVLVGVPTFSACACRFSTAWRSSRNSASVASMRSRLKSSMPRPWTIR